MRCANVGTFFLACPMPSNTLPEPAADVPESAADTVFHGIVQGLAQQRFVPGQRLVEVDLAAQFGVSRASVREALQRLAAEGLVDLFRNKGAAIRTLSARDPLEVPDVAEHLVPLGQAAVRRVGADVTLVSYAKTVGVCLQAAEQLQAQGIAAEVIDLRTLKPLDEATVLRSLRKTGRLVVVTEASGLCGMAAELAALAATRAFDVLRAPVVRLTGPDAPGASSWVLEQAALPTVEAVVEAVQGMLGEVAVGREALAAS